MFKIDLVTRDGAHVTFDAEPAESLLDAAERANIFLPSSCRGGGCGACRVDRKSGEAELGDCSESALSAADRANGGLLLCRTYAKSDLALTAPFNEAAISFSPVPVRTARIVEIARVGSGAVRLALAYENDPVHGGAAQFLPGQFAELTTPDTDVTRAYSIASTPNWDGTLEFLIRLHADGAFSAYLRDRAKPGDRLVVKGPQGSFAADENSQAPRFFVAGGTGLAPMLSMLRQMAEFGDMREAHLFFGVNKEAELFAQDALDELTRALPSLKVTVCVWTPGPGWSGYSGTPAQALADALAQSAARPDVYVCGPPALIEAARAVASAAGVAEDRVFSEMFAPA